jgi:N-acetylglucosamine kinase-like BadF-type ATPase
MERPAHGVVGPRRRPRGDLDAHPGGRDRRAGTGRSIAAAGNPVSHPDGAAAASSAALRAALARVDPGQVEASVIGVAGVSALRTPPVAARFGRVWADAGLRCDPGYATDLEVAFAAGTPGPDGSVLVAGTGATAGAVTDRRLTRTADGHGWLLGDDGPGFWLGREAVRAALRPRRRGARGRLVGAVLRELGATGTATRRHDRSSNAPRPRCSRSSAGSGIQERPRRSCSPGV